MTRRLRPPAPLRMVCRDDRPVELYRGGRRCTVTHIAATWVRPAAWWADDEDSDPLAGERTYFRVIVAGVLALEIFALARAEHPRWFLSRIID